VSKKISGPPTVWPEGHPPPEEARRFFVMRRDSNSLLQELRSCALTK
jgi:hypothetical protein